jgi:hypothetical protein
MEISCKFQVLVVAFSEEKSVSSTEFVAELFPALVCTFWRIRKLLAITEN